MRNVLRLIPLVAVVALPACAGGDGGDGETTASPPPASTVRCRQVPLPKPKPQLHLSSPRGELNPFKTYDVIVRTTCGRFTIRLDFQIPTRAVVSFHRLVKMGFYDKTFFHRIERTLIQGGDPFGNGFGGPGYTTQDDVPANTRYTRGVVGMAKEEGTPRGTAGSQFFVVTAQDAKLLREYVVVGRVVAGMDVVQAIGKRITPKNEDGDLLPPKDPVVVERMTLRVR